MTRFRDKTRISTLAALMVLVALVAVSPLRAGDSSDDPSEVLARVGDVVITRQQVEQAAREELLKIERQRHQVLETTVQRLVREQLLDQEAAKRGITRSELVEQEVNQKLGEISDEQVEQFYQENQVRIRRPKEEVAEQIKRYLQQNQSQSRQDTFFKDLEAQTEVKYLLEPMRFEIETQGSPGKGSPDAAVTIVAFSDFECPYCARLVPTLEKVADAYGDRVRVVFRQFPLPMHGNAQKAAEASLCANDQGKFWDMHDLLFKEQKQLQVPQLKAKAQALELDTESFNACLDSGKYAAQVQQDVEAGQQAGISGTPAMFVNGRFLSGAVPYEQIANVIDDELGRQADKVAASTN